MTVHYTYVHQAGVTPYLRLSCGCREEHKQVRGKLHATASDVNHVLSAWCALHVNDALSVKCLGCTVGQQLHQQHIREAVNQPLLTARVWLFPVLDTFVRGLPRTFRNTEAAPGSSISVQITGDAGGEWSLVRAGSGWELFEGRDPQAVCRV
jgi:hypothetical protein